MYLLRRFRRRRCFINTLSLVFTMSVLTWIVRQDEPLYELPDLLHPFPANHSSPPSLRHSVTLYNSNFSFFLNLTDYLKQYPALQNYRCRAAIGLVGYCRTNDPLILLAVKSHPASFTRREILRRTWARERKILDYRFKPVFLLANSGRRQQMEKVVEEAFIFEDIILWDFMESHHNLSLKERCFLEWVYYRCSEATYIFKGDDDEFVNPYAIANYILVSLPSHPLKIHGQLQIDPPSFHDGKYGVPVSIYPHAYYPYFVSGGGFLLPGSLVPSLYWASSTIPVFPLDDVFFGFLVLAVNISFHHEPRFYSFGLQSDKLCQFVDVLVAHGITHGKMLEIWEYLPDAVPCPPA